MTCCKCKCGEEIADAGTIVLEEKKEDNNEQYINNNIQVINNNNDDVQNKEPTTPFTIAVFKGGDKLSINKEEDIEKIIKKELPIGCRCDNDKKEIRIILDQKNNEANGYLYKSEDKKDFLFQEIENGQFTNLELKENDDINMENSETIKRLLETMPTKIKSNNNDISFGDKNSQVFFETQNINKNNDKLSAKSSYSNDSNASSEIDTSRENLIRIRNNFTQMRNNKNSINKKTVKKEQPQKVVSNNNKNAVIQLRNAEINGEQVDITDKLFARINSKKQIIIGNKEKIEDNNKQEGWALVRSFEIKGAKKIGKQENKFKIQMETQDGKIYEFHLNENNIKTPKKQTEVQNALLKINGRDTGNILFGYIPNKGYHYMTDGVLKALKDNKQITVHKYELPNGYYFYSLKARENAESEKIDIKNISDNSIEKKNFQEAFDGKNNLIRFKTTQDIIDEKFKNTDFIPVKTGHNDKTKSFICEKQLQEGKIYAYCYKGNDGETIVITNKEDIKCGSFFKREKLALKAYTGKKLYLATEKNEIIDINIEGQLEPKIRENSLESPNLKEVMSEFPNALCVGADTVKELFIVRNEDGKLNIHDEMFRKKNLGQNKKTCYVVTNNAKSDNDFKRITRVWYDDDEQQFKFSIGCRIKPETDIILNFKETINDNYLVRDNARSVKYSFSNDIDLEDTFYCYKTNNGIIRITDNKDERKNLKPCKVIETLTKKDGSFQITYKKKQIQNENVQNEGQKESCEHFSFPVKGNEKLINKIHFFNKKNYLKANLQDNNKKSFFKGTSLFVAKNLSKDEPLFLFSGVYGFFISNSTDEPKGFSLVAKVEINKGKTKNDQIFFQEKKEQNNDNKAKNKKEEKKNIQNNNDNCEYNFIFKENNDVVDKIKNLLGVEQQIQNENTQYKDFKTKSVKNKNIKKNNLSYQSEDEIEIDN